MIFPGSLNIKTCFSILLFTWAGSSLSAQDERKFNHYVEVSFLGIHRLESGVSTFQRVPVPQFINYTIYYKSYGVGLDYSSHYINNHIANEPGDLLITDLDFLSLRMSRAFKFGKRHQLEPLIGISKRWGEEVYRRVNIAYIKDWGLDTGFRYRFIVYKGFSLNISAKYSRYFPKFNEQSRFQASQHLLHNMFGLGYSF